MKTKIPHWLDKVEQDWGASPAVARQNMFPFYIAPLDEATDGMDGTQGELIAVQGPSKQRKSTFLVNLVVSNMMGRPAGAKNKIADHHAPPTAIFALESSMNGSSYRDTIIANVATRLLMEIGHKFGAYCQECRQPVCKHMNLYARGLRTREPSAVQKEAIDEAIRQMREWPLWIFDSRQEYGNVRNLEASTKLWYDLAKNEKIKIIAVDHLQQFHIRGVTSVYEKQLVVVPEFAGLVASQNVIGIMLSQISLSSKNASANFGAEQIAAGGDTLKSESSTVISTNYEDGSNTVDITLEAARYSGGFKITQELEKASGVFAGRVSTPTTDKSNRAGQVKDPRAMAGKG